MSNRRRRKEMSDEEREELFNKWDRILLRDGLSVEPRRPLMRDKQKDSGGVRKWRGPREISSNLIDVLGYDQRLMDATEKLMEEPHKPMGGYTTEELQELRETLLDAIEDTLTLREAEAMISIVLGSETYASVSQRMALPKSTCYLTVTRAIEKMEAALEDSPQVTKYLQRHSREETE